MSGDKEQASSSLDTGKGRGRQHQETPKKNKRNVDQDKKSVADQKREFEARYVEEHRLGEGGCGAVFAGYRIEDRFPVAIKHIPKNKVYCKVADESGKKLSVEVAIMLKLAGEAEGSVGTSAPVSLLEWFDIGRELILVLERPVPAVDLQKYKAENGGSLPEDKAKVILKQLVGVDPPRCGKWEWCCMKRFIHGTLIPRGSSERNSKSICPQNAGISWKHA
ncbi:unnamed protein product [Oreochromis niloticus]|nr:unnamed protein product [Mustela putorius furo]